MTLLSCMIDRTDLDMVYEVMIKFGVALAKGVADDAAMANDHYALEKRA
ncbi:MAG: hypothetical protein LBU32_12195 [Clostridiales bacterium]|jgi:hypothetical protein|nr:hypothetical protein [Clostridiales bacterium]